MKFPQERKTLVWREVRQELQPVEVSAQWLPPRRLGHFAQTEESVLQPLALAQREFFREHRHIHPLLEPETSEEPHHELVGSLTAPIRPALWRSPLLRLKKSVQKRKTLISSLIRNEPMFKLRSALVGNFVGNRKPS